ncbi:hypothetical protein J2Z21_009106 [Streptomyces griseochromogenes]|uniref:Transposase IS4-like domain-containing protein n=2 Tax=Streptomyces griseochromogenes TaxID=68214 RepID=A0ABS4M9N1_9ACTN|nr:hypothetical protein [Streptomyces griseochromogenes]
MRRTLEEAGVGYVLAVPKSQQLHAPFGRIDQAIADAPDEAWERHSCGDGAKGPRLYYWAAARLPAISVFDGDQPTHQRWVLARRRLAGADEIAYYLAYAPGGTSVADLVRVAGSRWAIEEAFQAAKNECGLDQYEVRRYPGWSPWPCLPTRSWPSSLPRQPKGGGGRNDTTSTIRFTVAEIRRLLDTLLPRPTPRLGPVTHALNWSLWRRQHQAITRRCHYRRRTSSGNDF